MKCMRSFLFILLSWHGLLLGSAKGQSADANRKVFVLAGDSTVTDDSGWGVGFAELMTEQAKCINMAKGGRSSRSYRTEGWWQKCLDLEPDYLLIQFGHNDQPGKGPERESPHDGAFRDHLSRFVDEAREKGIKPILVTSLTRRKWTRDGLIEPSLAEYAAATRSVAMAKSVPLIDLHQASIEQCEKLGPLGYRAFEPMKVDGADHTHLNLDGSRAVAPLVVTALLQALPEVRTCFSEDKVRSATVPQDYNKEVVNGRLHLKESDNDITILSRDKLVLTYNKQAPPVPDGMDPRYQRSGFLHPVKSPSGATVTATFPVDHPHQHGIFSAWVQTTWNDRNIDFWNLAKGSGRVLHQRVISTYAAGDEIGFEVDLIHRAEEAPVVDILREHWKVTVYDHDDSYHVFDIESTQHAQTELPLILHEYHYGGTAVRGPVAWLLPEKDSKDPATNPATNQGCSFLNDLGSDRIKGNHEHAKWVCMTGAENGQPVSIAVFSHPSNFRAPQAARIHPTKPYFVFSPCVDGEFKIDRKQPFRSLYRFIITDSSPDPKWLNEQWTRWTTSRAP